VLDEGHPDPLTVRGREVGKSYADCGLVTYLKNT